MKCLRTLPLLAVIALAACGGGGSSSPAPLPVMTLAPASSPTAQASAAPTATPIPTPTAAATAVPLALHVMGGAPLTATVAQLSTARAHAQAHTLAQGIENGLPILVESSGPVAAWAGDQAVWVTNVQTQADIPETSGTITPSGNLSISNPSFTPLSCLSSTSAICVVHPTAWTFGTASTNGKPVGQQMITVTFADGTTSTTQDDVYDGWNLPCNGGWAYVGGVPTAQTTRATSDVYADCVNGNIDFPLGAYVLSQPSSDQYGNLATNLPNFTAAPIFSAANGVFAFASIPPGIIFAVNTQDGGYAKVYFTAGAGVAVNAATGMSLHSLANGSFSF